jgi:glutathione synthase/RimK-type ligase-like ATP-grasp enzyme
MNTIIVVNNPDEWKFDIPDVEAISASDYLTEPAFSNLKGVRIYNLCRSYRYQSYGYYVSLLAAARGHKPKPSVTTINDMKSPSVIRVVSDDIDNLIQKALSHIQGDKFTLSIYFGRNVAKHYDQLCNHLYKLFEAPFLRAYFVKNDKSWHLQNISPISVNEIPMEHHDFISDTARKYFTGRTISVPKRTQYRFDLAILYNPEDLSAPSDMKAIEQFSRAAESIGISTEVIGKDDYTRIAEFDALFIRETTSVNHHTYRFARRAEAEGLVVVDDPLSILRCTNKVYLNELLGKNKIPVPPTLVIHKGNLRSAPAILSYPIILKQPDSSSSQGVVKVENAQEFRTAIEPLFEKSALVIGQTFMPTEFDWRVGIFDNQPLYVCKYFMASKHWQIIKTDQSTGKRVEGKYETMSVSDTPQNVINLALRTAKLIGDGLYGVDIKQVGNRLFVIEINDNPSIDCGVEDAILKKDLYLQIMNVFLRRLEKRKGQNVTTESADGPPNE